MGRLKKQAGYLKHFDETPSSITYYQTEKIINYMNYHVLDDLMLHMSSIVMLFIFKI